MQSPTDPKRTITKRIVALPGDLVEPLRKKGEKVPIPQGHCRIEGDEHFIQETVPIGLINAKAKYILWPPSRFGPVPDRVIPKNRVEKNAFRPEFDERGTVM
ncbi:unnamed protein product [Rhizopus stolonifer]